MSMSNFSISGRLIDLFERRIYPANITVKDGFIDTVTEVDDAPLHYILPGFVDAHVHIESSMLVPTAFAKISVIHGTVATVSDPHEIANVCGIEGVQYMIGNAKETPFKFFFGAPSCVPATPFETAGATIDAAGIEQLLQNEDIWYLAEMMNYPGVLHKDAEVMAKMAAAKRAGKPIDGHAPGLKGNHARDYAEAGISTDHECFELDEALGKIHWGMYCLIREGSAAKNFEALAELIRLKPHAVMFCSDDKHPDELALHHINNHVKRALAKGYDLFDVLRAACVHPVLHYNLPVGLLRPNDPADFIVVEHPGNFKILQTYIDGALVADGGKSLLQHTTPAAINNFKATPRAVKDFEINAANDEPRIKVIEAIEGQLITNCIETKGRVENGFLVSDTSRDILKIAVINRYEAHAKPAIAFIKNFGLKKGALASTIAHDCHNIIAIGVDDLSLCNAVNALIAAKGGIAVADANDVDCMPLPIAGLMSDQDGDTVAMEYTKIDTKAKALGTPLHAPFMTLSFMALLVIPSLKISDKGLFDGTAFQFANLQG